MPDKARRPYLDLDEHESGRTGLKKPATIPSPLENSLVRMPSRYLSLSLDKESEFEKPYDGTSPRKQHFDFPYPDWPGDWGPRSWDPDSGEGFPTPRTCPHCALAFDPIYNCEEDWGEAHAMIYCSYQPGFDCPDCQMTVRAIVGEIVSIEPGTWSRRADIELSGGFQYQVTDPFTGQTKWVEAPRIDPLGDGYAVQGLPTRRSIAPITGTMSLKVQVNANIPEHILVAEMIDGAGNYCQTWLEVICACCPAQIPFTIDAANTDLVTSSKAATVTVLGGCGPYIWSVAGTGWSIVPSGTSALMAATITVNTSVCNKTTSVPLATVTVTDFCGTTVTQEIKHEGGAWEGIASFGNDAGCDYALCQCSAKTSHSDVYKKSNNDLYQAKWTGQMDCSCLASCDSGCDSSTTLGAGSDCGATTVTRAECGISNCPTCCWANGALSYWTCGADCS